ncbi:hypothetical protein [Citrobacter telavivensis]
MKQYRYHHLCQLTSLFLLLFASEIAFANSQLSLQSDNNLNKNCTTENGIITCKTVFTGTTSTTNAVVGSGTPARVENRRNNDDKDLKVYKLVPNEGQSMLRGELNNEQLKAEMSNKMLSEGGNY